MTHPSTALVLFLSTLAACAPAEDSWGDAPVIEGSEARTASLTGPALTLTVGTLVPTQTVTFGVYGAGPNEVVQLARSTAGPGSGPCLGTLGALCLDVASPVVHATLTTDSNGTGTLVQALPESVPIGTDVWFQAVIARGATGSLWLKSPGVQATVEDAPLTVPAMGPGDLRITEIMADPLAVPDAVGEWFEVVNASGLDANLDGLTISNGVASFVLSGTTMLDDGERLVFGAELDPAANGGVAVDRELPLALPDTFGELVLLDGTVVLDAVGWDDGTSFPLTPGFSLTLPEELDHVDNDLGASWCVPKVRFGAGDYGSPGTANSCEPLSLTLVDEADATLTGAAIDDLAGFSVAGAGDVNGDGFDDVIVGAPYSDASGVDAGAAYLLLGPIEGSIDLGAADARILGESAFDNAGYSVAGAGDVNGDGYDDLLVGAYRHSSVANHAGAAYLVLGPVTGDVRLASAADARLLGGSVGDYAGYSVAGAGDVDGDGYDDLLIGAHGVDTNGLSAGAAYVVLGPVVGDLDLDATADARLYGMEPSDVAGISVAGVGDVDGDGFDDVLIGAPRAGADGTAYLLRGPVTGALDLASADARLLGDVGDYAGASVSGAGDVNGDGLSDLIIGAQTWGVDDEGAAYVVHGPVGLGDRPLSTAQARLIGEAAGDLAGMTVAGAGDVDGDGLDDLLVSTYTGQACLMESPILGDRTLDFAALRMVGPDSTPGLLRVAGAGDVDGDGLDDMLVGDAYYDVIDDEGVVFLVHGE